MAVEQLRCYCRIAVIFMGFKISVTVGLEIFAVMKFLRFSQSGPSTKMKFAKFNFTSFHTSLYNLQASNDFPNLRKFNSRIVI